MTTQKRHIARNKRIIKRSKKEWVSEKELGKMFNLSSERIRQIIGKSYSIAHRKSEKEKRMKEMIPVVEKLARKLGRLPTYKELKGYTKDSVEMRILRAHLLQLGFKGHHHYTKKYLLDHLKDLAKTLGRTPGQPDILRDGWVSPTTYTRYFGGTSKAQKAAGLVPNKTGQSSRRHTDEWLLEHLREIAKELGRSPLSKDIDAKGQIDSSAYYRHFGSLKTARKKVGLPQPVDERRQRNK